ncbi:MAG: hypothetical protein VW394_07580, partial [Candidatus Heimdallarchaeota archaeon]
HIPSLNIGVLIIDWKRPISIQIVNKAIQILRELKLTTLYLISKEISDPAQKKSDEIRRRHYSDSSKWYL